MSGKELWYIDALDARGGQAFASVREADLDDAEIDLGAPAVFIGPPAFQAETVSGRAVAFAATRGVFQLGLYDKQEEVGFTSLDRLIAFVRRAYLASGGGDGGGGVGPTPPPGPPEGPGGEPWRPGEPESSKETKTSAAQLLLKHANEFMASIPGETDGAPPVVQWWEGEERGADRGDGDYRILARAAALLTDSLLRRFPGINVEAFGGWRDACCRLGAIIDAFGLWQFLLVDGATNSIRDVALKTITGTRELGTEGIPYKLGERGFGALAVLELLGGSPCRGPYYLDHWRYFYREVLRGRVQTGRWTSDRALDPLDTLSILCLPEIIAKYLELDKKTASVRDLLCVTVASPDLIVRHGNASTYSGKSDSTDIVAILIFAAAYIASVDSFISHSARSPRLAERLANELVSEAMKWLRTQFPSQVFAEPIEEMIRSAASLRYAA
jgi:hypothetical protein